MNFFAVLRYFGPPWSGWRGEQQGCDRCDELNLLVVLQARRIDELARQVEEQEPRLLFNGRSDAPAQEVIPARNDSA